MPETDQALLELVQEQPAAAGGRLRQHLSQPFFRNAYSLMLNTGLTGLMGIVYWAVAARSYGDADVGRGSATISVMTLLSGLVALNVTGTVTRFVGRSGRRTGRFVALIYLFTAVAVAVLAVGFLLTLRLWGPSYVHLGGLSTGMFFTGAVVASAIFTLQDGVLTSLRRAGWVPLENAVFGAVKLGLLIFFASRSPRDGVYLSWIIPMALLLLPVSGLIFGRFIPQHARAADPADMLPTAKQIRRFFAGDYIGAVFLFATMSFLPVLVSTQLPLYAFGYFYVAWTVGGLLNLVAINVATSLTVEGVYDRSTLAANCRAAIIRSIGLLLIAAVGIALVAPYGLRFLGRGYLDAVPLLQLLGLAALPTALTDIYIGVLRAQNASRHIALVQAFRGILVIGTVFAALHLDGLWQHLGMTTTTGVGLAVVAGQTVVALSVLPPLRRVAGVRPRSAPVPLAEVHNLYEAPVMSAGITAPASAPVFRRPLEPVPAAADPAARPWLASLRGWAPAASVYLLTVAGLVAFLLPLRKIDLSRMNDLGMLSVLPVASLVGLALLAVAFAAALALRRAHRWLLACQLVLMVLCLHGLPTLVEKLPRFSTAWVHVGFIEYITRTGSTDPGFDGRFSWPGFFALFALLTHAHGWQNLVWVLRLTPVVSNLLYLLPLALILRSMRAHWRAKWLAAWLFTAFNWVGQDYFSPQGFTYLVYLLFLAVLITWFRSAGTLRPPWARWLRRVRLWPRRARIPIPRLSAATQPGDLPPRPVGSKERVALFVVLLGLYVVATVSHQLTPFLMIAATAGLTLVGRCALPGILAVMIVILAGWISFMGVGYWSGHLNQLVGGLGHLLGNISTSVGQRAVGSSALHAQVLHARVLFTVVVFVLAGLGALRRRWRGFDDRTGLVLLLCPLVSLGLQSYGGEIALRVYLFTIPAACLFVAYLFFPGVQDGHHPVANGRAVGSTVRARGARARAAAPVAATAVAGMVFAGSFVLTAYGNESFEQVRPGEVAAMEYIYQHSSGSTQVVWLGGYPIPTRVTPTMVNDFQDLERVTLASAPAPRVRSELPVLLDQVRGLGPSTYLLTTRAQEAELQLAEGYPADWGRTFRSWMATVPQVHQVYANPDAAVYVEGSTGPGQDTPAGAPARKFVAQTMTPITPAGVVMLAALLAVLLVREYRWIRLLHGERLAVRPCSLAALPLAFGLLMVVLERFAVLS